MLYYIGGDFLNNRYNKRLGKQVSEIGFGAWKLGAQSPVFHMTEEEGIELIREAVKQGVTVFDTAPNYADGNSEVILGKALKEVREQVVINTKVGHGPNESWEFSKEGIQRSISRSLQRLQTSYIDSVILHNPAREILQGKNELFTELIRLKKEGKIRLFGVSIDTLEELQLILDNDVDVDTIEIMFNMIHQDPRYLFEECKKRDIMLIIKVPLDSGWLTGKYNESSIFHDIRQRWSKEEIVRRARIVEDFKSITNSSNLIHDALRYILSFDAVTTVIPGIKNRQQLVSNVAASNMRLPDNIVQQINHYYDTILTKQSIPW